jgi:hypothetical protein
LGLARQGKVLMQLELSIETTLAADILRHMVDNNIEITTYEELSRVIEKDAQTDGYGHVYSARRIVENERKCVFVVVPGIGIKVATPNEVVNTMGAGLEHGRRTYRRVMRRGVTLTPVEKQQELSEDAKRLCVSRLHRAAIHLHFDKPSSIKKLNSIIANNEIGSLPAPKELIAQLVTSHPRRKHSAQDSPVHIEAPGSAE